MSLLAIAEQLGPELAAARAEGDEAGRLPDSAWKALLESGILRSLQPKRWGGGEVHLLEYVDAVTAVVSRANPSAGWVAGVIGVHPFQLALFDERAQEAMWADDPATMHSSSYMPTGKAETVDGGYRISGRWSFSSGCDHCHGVNLGAVVRGGEVPDFRSFLLLPGQYAIEDNWNVAGLQATGSKDIVVEETFVPEHLTQSHLDYAMGRALPGQARNDGVLYRLPQPVVFNMALTASILGSAQGFLDVWIDESKDRVLMGGARMADDVLQPAPPRRGAVGPRRCDHCHARRGAHDVGHGRSPRDPDDGSAGSHAVEHQPRVRSASRSRASTSTAPRPGRTVFVDHPLHARFQDLQTGLGHAYLAPDPLAKAVGGDLLGTSKPEFVL